MALSTGHTVTIIIPTLSTGNLLNSCLISLGLQTFRDFEVVVVNNSGAPWGPEPAPNFPYQVVEPGSNIGFAAAVNAAIKSGSAPLIAVLNDDTEPDPGWLDALVREIEADPKVGMCASRIRLFENDLIDSAGMLICLDGSSKQRGHLQPHASFPGNEEALCPSACAALYRRELLEGAGLFDESFFLYCEDTDLGLRSRWLGWGCRYVAGATVRHHYSATAGRYSEMKAYYVERNRIFVALKNFPLLLLPMVPLVSFGRYFAQLASVRTGRGAASEYIRSGNSLLAAAKIVFSAHLDAIPHLPGLMKQRAKIQSMRRLGTWEFIRLVRRYRISGREIARV